MRKRLGEMFISIGEKLCGKKQNDIDLESVEKLLVHKRYRKNFSVKELREKSKEWILKLVEKKDRIPKALKGKDVVFNGYKEKVEIIDHPFVGKLLYLQFYRRKWKEKGTTKSYCNQYELHPPGMKATKEFGSFLKELDRQERDEFFYTFQDIRHISQEDF